MQIITHIIHLMINYPRSKTFFHRHVIGRFYGLYVATVLLCVLIPLPVFCGSSDGLTVSAAMSLKNAFEEIGRLYESQYGTEVTFNFGASGALAMQILGGAPVDVFASAAQKDMNEIEKKGLVVPGTRVDFAGNRVVLVVPRNSKVPVQSIKGLMSAKIKLIALGNPKTVPAGRYAAEVLESFNLFVPLKEKLIYAENVRQVLDYVARGEVDAGFVYATDAAFGRNETKVVAIAPEGSHRPIIYSIALVQGTRKEAAARDFISVVISMEAGEILQKYGFKAIR